MPKRQITTSMDLKSAYQSIIEILCDIQYEECSTLLEDCLRERATMKDLDVDVSESEEEEEEQEEDMEEIVDDEDFDINNEIW
jgi:hypothetical protein